MAVTGNKQIKMEEVARDCNEVVGHSHNFTVKFGSAGSEYSIECYRPSTVLNVIKSHLLSEFDEFKKKNEHRDRDIIIQLGKEDKKYIVPTHFPCTCVEDGEFLIVTQESEKIEEVWEQHDKEVLSRESYVFFYIDKEGGQHTKTKEVFRSKAVKQFKFLCVYGEKEMTVEEALRNDGRFIDDLGDFSLTNNENPGEITKSTKRIKSLHLKEFKICLPRQKKGNTKAKNQQQRPDEQMYKKNMCASKDTQDTGGTISVHDIAHERGVSVKHSHPSDTGPIRDTRLSSDTCPIGDTRPISSTHPISDTRPISNARPISDNSQVGILRQQFPELRKVMKSRFPGESFQKEVTLRKENFGKIQQSFSEVHRVKMLLDMGKSVCKIVVRNVCTGTGFVLFDSLILTNAHLLKDCVEGKSLQEGVEVFVLFNYEERPPNEKYFYFSAEKTLADIDFELDYAVLELKPDGQRPNQQANIKSTKIPPGLLVKIGPLPKCDSKANETGEACLIGHPRGDVKKIDLTWIIEAEKREQSVRDNLAPYERSLFTLQSVTQTITKQGIQDIMKGGRKADEVVTYNTFMYHGSSGSPVFDARGQVFALHTAGFCYGFQGHEESVIEFAQPLLTIFKKFVGNLKASDNKKLLERVEQVVAKKNMYIKKILHPEPADVEEPMEFS